MTRPSLAGIEKRVEDVRRNAQYGNGSRSRRLVNEASAADAPALTAAVRDVLAMHAEATCSRGYPQAYCIDCDQAWPCATVRALAARLDLTDPEGDPT